MLRSWLGWLSFAWLLCTSVFGQKTSPVQTISEVPYVTITFTGREGNFYKFQVANTSAHGVSAFAVRLLAGGTNLSIGDNASPVVKAFQGKDLKFDLSSVGAGVIVDAAVFDDESFAGEEPTAAAMVARQIGNQAEYDRIVSTVEAILASHVETIEKTLRIRRELGDLSADVDTAMVRTFNRWFPDLADCNRGYLRRMKGAAVAEKAAAVESIEQFAHSAAPGLPTLEQWWASTKQRLSIFGCNGCAAQASNPKPPPREQVLISGCQADPDQQLIIFVAELTGDDFADAIDPNNDPELAPEEVAAADSEHKSNTNSRPVPPPPRPAPAESATGPSQPEKREAAPTPASRPATLYPAKSGVALARTPDGRFLLYRIHFDHPAPDYEVYAALFRDIGNLGNDALYEEVEVRGNNTVPLGNDPPAGGLDDLQIKILRQAALACNQELDDLRSKEINLYSYSAWADYPRGWVVFAPPDPEKERLQEQRTRTLNRYIKVLHMQLGAVSSAKLEGFARKVYRTVPGRTVILPMTQDRLYFAFFRYTSMLGQTQATKQESAKRQKELLALGLGKDAWTTLQRVGTSFDQARSEHDAKINKLQADSKLYVTRPAPANQAAFSPAIPAPAALPMPMQGAATTAAMPQPAVATPLGVLPTGTNTIKVPSPEFLKVIEEGKLMVSEHIQRLQTELGKADFQKLDKYVHQLYAHAGQTTFVATSAKPKEPN